MVEESGVEESGVEKSRVENSGVEMSFNQRLITVNINETYLFQLQRKFV